MKNVIVILSGITVVSLLIGISITNFAELAILISMTSILGIALLMAIDSNRTVKQQTEFINNLLKK